MILLVMAVVPLLDKWLSLVLSDLRGASKLLIDEFIHLDTRQDGLLLELVLLLLQIGELLVCLLLLHETLWVIRSLEVLLYCIVRLCV